MMQVHVHAADIILWYRKKKTFLDCTGK